MPTLSPVEARHLAELSREFNEVVTANPQDAQTDELTESDRNRRQTVHEEHQSLQRKEGSPCRLVALACVNAIGNMPCSRANKFVFSACKV